MLKSISKCNLTPIVYTANGFHSMDLLVGYVWISLAAPTDRLPSEISWSRPFTWRVGWWLSVFCRQIMSSGSGNITSSAFSPVKDSTTAAWHSLFLFSFLCFAFLLASFRLLLTPLFFECLPVAQTPSLAALWYFPDYLPEYGLIINASWRGGGGGGVKNIYMF